MKARRTPIVIPILLVILGMAILLGNFYLIDLRLGGYWPIALILLGLQVLLRGDLAFSWQAQSFGITRGNVENASLEVNSGEIDVHLRSLQRTGRLIAGQYTARSRPKLHVRDNRARLILKRGDTWFFSLADWDLELAPDLPWSILLSSHLGEIDADLRGLAVEQAHIASGIGNLKVVCPNRLGGTIYVRSTFGDIQLLIPKNVPAAIEVKASPLSNVSTKGAVTQLQERPNMYVTGAFEQERPNLEIIVSATFGNILLAASR